jgi:putative ATPase
VTPRIPRRHDAQDRKPGGRASDLFAAAAERNAKPPLADRMRPRTLDEFIGQSHILGPGRLLRRAIQADRVSSLIFAGPPGTGKTTLARIIANTTQSQFLAINAVLAGVKEIRESIEYAREARELRGQGTILFVDEVHRFNKAQQDALLPHVENGTLTLIGATTENPFFEVNKALVSRSRVFQLRSLEDADLRAALEAAIADPERGYGKLNVRADEDALNHIVRMAQGDARSALNALELAIETTPPDAADPEKTVRLTVQVAEESIQRKAVLYDKDGDAHYDTISAFIKSVRGSDPDASLYWLAKMVEAGEDTRFIFRRMIILAAEDVGLADPDALRVVMAAAQAFDYVGLPEGQFHLAEACLYLATAPKSNSTMAYFDALESVRSERIGEVPDPLRDASRDKELGHGHGYLYPHAFRDHWVEQQYLPSGLRGRVFYEPGSLGHEAGLRIETLRRREAQWAALEEAAPRAVAASLKSDWLERAAGVGSDALRKVRDALCESAGLKRESLVLDLGGHHGFLTWEALRRCVEGGVWTRCETEGERLELEAWIRRVDPLHRPELCVSSLAELPQAILAAAEKREGEGRAPRFDAILGLGTETGLDPDAWSVWIRSISKTVGPQAAWALACRRPPESVPWSVWMSEAPAALRAKVLRAAEAPESSASAPDSSLGARWETALAAAGYSKVQRRTLRFEDKRRLTPSQAREWFGRFVESGSLNPLIAALDPADWTLVQAAAIHYLSGGLRDFPVSFEVVTAVSA